MTRYKFVSQIIESVYTTMSYFCAKGLVSLCLFIYFWLEKYPWENILQNIDFNKIFSLTHMFSVSRLPWLWSLWSIFYNFGELSPFSYFCKTFDGLVGIDLCSEQRQTLLHVVIEDKWRGRFILSLSECEHTCDRAPQSVCHTKKHRHPQKSSHLQLQSTWIL